MHTARHRRRAGRLALAACLLSLWATGACAEGPSAARPSFLLVIADDLGVHGSGAYGSPSVSTPRLDALAREGLRFDAAYTAVPECTPSRTTLYTGRLPGATGVARNLPVGAPGDAGLRSGIVTLPARLAERGYRVALAGKSHVEPAAAFPFERLDPGGVDDFLAQVGDTPFLLVVALHAPHRPYPDPPVTDPADVIVSPDLVDTPVTRQQLAGYHDRIAAMDAELGVCLDALVEYGHADETLVLFTSDHGASLPFAKWTLYEAGVRVPLVARWPDHVAADTATDAFVSLADVAPTLVDLAGGPPLPDADGRSFVELLGGRTERHADAVFTQFDTGDGGAQRAVRAGRFKLIVNLPPRRVISRLAPGQPLGAMLESWIATGDETAVARAARLTERPPRELYDLRADPYELHDLATDPARADEREALTRQLAAWCAAQGDPRAAEITAGD